MQHADFLFLQKISFGKSEDELDFYLIEVQLVWINFVKLSKRMH